MINEAHTEGMTPDVHYRLALQIAEHGIRAHHDDVTRYVSELRRHGHRSTLLDITLDPTQPEVARERAFGRLPTSLDAMATPVVGRAA
jgi:hypothetical protein